MRRWFLAVFALHFFLSVGASAFGKTSTAAPLPQVFALAACVQEDALPALDSTLTVDSEALALAEIVHEHALADDQHEFPDDLNIRIAAAPRRVADYPPARSEQGRSPSPALDVPHKPPRATALVA